MKNKFTKESLYMDYLKVKYVQDLPQTMRLMLLS